MGRREGRMKMYWGGYWYVQNCRMVGRGGGVEGEWREWKGRIVVMLRRLVVLHVIVTCSVEVSRCWRSLTVLSILET